MMSEWFINYKRDLIQVVLIGGAIGITLAVVAFCYLTALGHQVNEKTWERQPTWLSDINAALNSGGLTVDQSSEFSGNFTPTANPQETSRLDVWTSNPQY
jgi:hypothetical protein